MPQVIAAAPVFRGGSWNRKGFIMFVPNPSIGLFTVPGGGGEAQPLAGLGLPETVMGPGFCLTIRISPISKSRAAVAL